MKVVEKSPAVYLYECEKCKSQYETESDAATCEQNHEIVVGIIENDKTYEKDEKYPTSVTLRMSDGQTCSYVFKPVTVNDITDNNTRNGEALISIVENYTVFVQKEYVEDEVLKVEKLSNVGVSLKDRILSINIPDSIQVLSTDSICVKVVDENGNELVAGSENPLFDEIVISAEVKTTIDNSCIESTTDDTAN